MRFEIIGIDSDETVLGYADDPSKVIVQIHLSVAEVLDLAEKLLAAAHYMKHGCWPEECTRG